MDMAEKSKIKSRNKEQEWARLIGPEFGDGGPAAVLAFEEAAEGDVVVAADSAGPVARGAGREVLGAAPAEAAEFDAGGDLAGMMDEWMSG